MQAKLVREQVSRIIKDRGFYDSVWNEVQKVSGLQTCLAFSLSRLHKRPSSENGKLRPLQFAHFRRPRRDSSPRYATITLGVGNSANQLCDLAAGQTPEKFANPPTKDPQRIIPNRKVCGEPFAHRVCNAGEKLHPVRGTGSDPASLFGERFSVLRPNHDAGQTPMNGRLQPSGSRLQVPGWARMSHRWNRDGPRWEF